VNALNRLIMLVIALLLIAVPVVLLLVGFGVLSADQINIYTGYRNALDSLGRLLSASDFDIRTHVVVGLIGALLALVAMLLLLREIPLGRRVARRALIEDEPGRETAITSGAVRQLAESAAREAGAASPTCYLASEKRGYDVACNVLMPRRSLNFDELATRTQNNIRKVLEEQQVPVREIQVTVQGTAPRG
jgi:hypothetical protein